MLELILTLQMVGTFQPKRPVSRSNHAARPGFVTVLDLFEERYQQRGGEDRQAFVATMRLDTTLRSLGNASKSGALE